MKCTSDELGGVVAAAVGVGVGVEEREGGS